MGKILVIGGTSTSEKLAIFLHQKINQTDIATATNQEEFRKQDCLLFNIPSPKTAIKNNSYHLGNNPINNEKVQIILSVATSLGKDVYKNHAYRTIFARFTEESLSGFIYANELIAVIDASHPHSTEISNVVNAVAQNIHNKNFDTKHNNISSDSKELNRLSPTKNLAENVRPFFIRLNRQSRNNLYNFERLEKSGKIRLFDSMEEIIRHLKKIIEINKATKIMVTGVKHISDFYRNIPSENLYFRTMPSTFSIEQTAMHKVPLDRIIALKTPISPEFGEAMLREYGIDYFVFKESGEGSAFISNLEAVMHCDTKALIVKSPKPGTTVDAVIETESIQEVFEIIMGKN